MNDSEKRLFRFGVGVQGAASHEAWMNQARKIEGLGYAMLLVPDHFTGFSPSVALQAAADATTKLCVGSYVFANDFRHPVVLARDAATLDMLTGGRFEMGIGGGWHKGEYEQAGIPFETPGVRVSRLEESICVLKGLLTDEPLTFTGKHYAIHGLNGFPKPVQRPYPPLFIGGSGKRVLTLAAREANIIGIQYKMHQDMSVDLEERTSAALAHKVALIREVAGERFDQVELNLLTEYVEITNDRQRAIERFLQARNWQHITVEQVIDMPYVLIGTMEQIVEELQMRRELCHISYIAIFDMFLDTFAPVVERLAGR